MYKYRRPASFVFFSGSGCLLPVLIILNLLFGWIFFRPKLWLIVQAILLVLFVINAYISARKIISPSSKRDDIIDVEAEVVEDK